MPSPASAMHSPPHPLGMGSCRLASARYCFAPLLGGMLGPRGEGHRMAGGAGGLMLSSSCHNSVGNVLLPSWLPHAARRCRNRMPMSAGKRKCISAVSCLSRGLNTEVDRKTQFQEILPCRFVEGRCSFGRSVSRMHTAAMPRSPLRPPATAQG